MAKPNPNVLIVEGQDDLFAVAHLMDSHVHWPSSEEHRPVHIRVGDGAQNILKKEFIDTALKQSGLKRLAIVLDADANPVGRWVSARGLLADTFPNLPEQMPADGLIAENEDGLRLGLWLMPDNQSEGMLETFLQHLVPSAAKGVWSYAQVAVRSARRRGAQCRDVHDTKAAIHTWLAWQDPPGDHFGVAVSKRVLDPHSPAARPFVEWFRAVYQLEAKHGEGNGGAGERTPEVYEARPPRRKRPQKGT